MKKIEAIIRKTRFEDVKEALLESDINWFEYHNVHGIGQSREERIYRGVQYSTDVIERVAITIVCRDQFVEPTVNGPLKGDDNNNTTQTQTPHLRSGSPS